MPKSGLRDPKILDMPAIDARDPEAVRRVHNVIAGLMILMATLTLILLFSPGVGQHFQNLAESDAKLQQRVAEYDGRVIRCYLAYFHHFHNDTLTPSHVYDDELGCFEHVSTEVIGSKRGVEPVLKDVYRLLPPRFDRQPPLHVEIVDGHRMKTGRWYRRRN